MNEPHHEYKDVGMDIKDNSLTGGLSLSYNKVNKLITALYIVTDILDSGEPLRSQLRTAGTDILSDIYILRTNRSNSVSYRVIGNILKAISLLDIASTVGILSTMNCSILRNEFIELKNAVSHALENYTALSGEINLSEFFNTDPGLRDGRNTVGTNTFTKLQMDKPTKRTLERTRIGVQSGSTLLKAISDKVIDKRTSLSFINHSASRENHNNVKKERRDIILSIIKSRKDGATITDIHRSAYGPLKDVGEKTLQRELVSMVGSGVLKKVGAKRWSRYFLNDSKF